MAAPHEEGEAGGAGTLQMDDNIKSHSCFIAERGAGLSPSIEWSKAKIWERVWCSAAQEGPAWSDLVTAFHGSVNQGKAFLGESWDIKDPLLMLGLKENVQEENPSCCFFPSGAHCPAPTAAGETKAQALGCPVPARISMWSSSCPAPCACSLLGLGSCPQYTPWDQGGALQPLPGVSPSEDGQQRWLLCVPRGSPCWGQPMGLVLVAGGLWGAQ